MIILALWPWCAAGVHVYLIIHYKIKSLSVPLSQHGVFSILQAWLTPFLSAQASKKITFSIFLRKSDCSVIHLPYLSFNPPVVLVVWENFMKKMSCFLVSLRKIRCEENELHEDQILTMIAPYLQLYLNILIFLIKFIGVGLILYSFICLTKCLLVWVRACPFKTLLHQQYYPDWKELVILSKDRIKLVWQKLFLWN